MNEEFGTATQIILARIDSHPDEFKDPYGRWGDIMEAIQEKLLGHKNRLWGLTDAEVKAIEEKLRTQIWAPQFNDAVMEKVLDPQKEERAEQRQMAAGMRIQGQGIKWTDPALAQNVILPGGVYSMEVEQKARQLGLAPLLKKTINKLKL